MPRLPTLALAALLLAPPAAAAQDSATHHVARVNGIEMHYHGEYVPRLAGHGAPVTAERVVTSARGTALHLRAHESQIRRVLAVGAGGLERELREAGFDVVTAGYAATRMAQEGIDGWAAAGRVRWASPSIATSPRATMWSTTSTASGSSRAS